MQAYIIRRLLLTIPTVFFVSVIVFVTIRLLPGTIIDQMQAQFGGGFGAQRINQAAIKHKLGLDVPVYTQYMRWIGGIILHGDLGDSLWKGTPVMKDI